MPSLFRFLVFLGILSALVYGVVFALALVEPKQRDITFTVPNDKFYKNR